MKNYHNSLSAIFLRVENTVREALNMQEEACNNGLPKGMALVVDNQEKLIGTLTDGDIRRALIGGASLEDTIDGYFQKNPIAFHRECSIREILDKLPGELSDRNRKSSSYLSKIVITDDDNKPLKVLEYHQLWEHRMALHRKVAVIGLGYVGLTLALVLADSGFQITGFDIDQEKVEKLNNGTSYIHEVGLPEMLRENIGKTFVAVNNLPDQNDVFIISVGTPVERNNGKVEPNLDHLKESLRLVGRKLRQGNLVILRSTVPVGTCRNFVVPELEKQSRLKCGFDFHLAFAPERTAEGNAIKELRELPQIIGGFNEDALEATAALFKELTSTIVRVDSLESAEMVKLVNNTYRDYVFAYSNFISRIAYKFNIDVNNVIAAANKGYPRDKVPMPSPGVGGPCLTKDPYIFSSVVEQTGLIDPVFKVSRSTNEGMHQHVVEQIKKGLNITNKSFEQAKILICGLAFKGNPETGDIRNSSSLEILKLLENEGIEVYGYDAVTDIDDLSRFNIKYLPIPAGFENMDAVLFLNNHRSFQKVDVYSMVRAMAKYPIVYDGWKLFHEDDILSSTQCLYMSLSHISSSIK